jgi:SAM-dependent methyltransferase
MKSLASPGANVLEIGVGCGYVLSNLPLGAVGRRVGVDNDLDSIRLAGRVAGSFGVSIDRIRGDAQRLPFATGSFDLVYSQGLIEHFPPSTADRLVAEHVRVAKPGAVIALSVPNVFNLFHTWLKWRQGCSYRFYPERSYTPQELASLLERHGVSVLGRDGYGLFWSLWDQRSVIAYYTSALALRLGLNQQFETRLTPALRARLCMMTFAWGRRSTG